MQNIIINVYAISDFHFKFCQVNRGISNLIENYSQLPPSAREGRGLFFLTVCAMVSSQIIFKSFLGAEFLSEVVLNLVCLSIFSGLAALMSADIARNL